jgi:cysteine desulfurase
LHSFGQKALAAVDEARESIAGALGADFREIMFAGSATEANNTALRGVVARSGIQHPRIIVSATEHESVLETARDLEKNGAEVVYLPVDVKGVVKLEALKRALTERTVLVSVMYVNNETGAVQPLMNIADIIKKFRGAGKYPLFHTDAHRHSSTSIAARKHLAPIS